MTMEDRITRLERAVAQAGAVLVAAALGASKWRVPHSDLDELIAEHNAPRPAHDVTVAPNDRFGQRGGI
jgi:hypothetical protein